MRIVIDLQAVQTSSRFRGIGLYSLELTKAIVRNSHGHEVLIVINGLQPEGIERIREEFDGILPQQNIKVWYGDSLLPPDGSNLIQSASIAELLRNSFIESLNPDILHICSLFEGFNEPAVCSIGQGVRDYAVSVSFYDLIPLLNAEKYLLKDSEYSKFYYQKLESFQRADLLLAISEFSKNEAMESGLFKNSTTNSVGAAASSIFKPIVIKGKLKKNILNRFQIKDGFILNAGGADERKNLPRLIKAYAGLQQKVRNNYQLVLVGDYPKKVRLELEREVELNGIGARFVIFTGFVSNEDLVSLYNLCSLFVFPSWHEGFGLPALEAMSCGAAVIGAGNSSLNEVIGDKNAMFNPFSTEAIRLKIEEVLLNDNVKKRLVASGLRQSESFSWEACGRKAISFFESSIANMKSKGQKSSEELVEKLIYDMDALSPRQKILSEQQLVLLSKDIEKNLIFSMKKTIFVDVSQILIDDFKTGIQRVVRAVVNQLRIMDSTLWEFKFVYLVQEHGYWFYRLVESEFNSGISTQSHAPGPVVEPRAGDVFLGLDLVSAVSWAAEGGLYRSWRDRGVEVVFIVYDILPVLHPEWWPQGGGVAHTRWLQSISGSASKLISISRSVNNSVKGWISVNSVKTYGELDYKWFHLGADLRSTFPSSGVPNDSQSFLSQVEKRMTFLMVGTLEPRKGHSQVLKGFQILWDEGLDINLVFVGKAGWLVDSLVAEIESNTNFGVRLFWMEGISDEYLEVIYSKSSCLIAASEGEGFGLPLIEAASYGIPMLVRDIPVFREVAGDHACYFEGVEPIDIAHSIKNWRRDFEFDVHPKSKGMPSLSWKESAEHLIEALKL